MYTPRTQVYWRRSMPILTVVAERSQSYGRCYSGTTYKVESTIRLGKLALDSMFLNGIFGAGQEFNIKSQCDGKEEPAGFELVMAKEYDTSTWAVVNEKPTNPHGEMFPPMKEPFYVYMVERRTDSGD